MTQTIEDLKFEIKQLKAIIREKDRQLELKTKTDKDNES